MTLSPDTSAERKTLADPAGPSSVLFPDSDSALGGELKAPGAGDTMNGRSDYTSIGLKAPLADQPHVDGSFLAEMLARKVCGCLEDKASASENPLGAVIDPATLLIGDLGKLDRENPDHIALLKQMAKAISAVRFTDASGNILKARMSAIRRTGPDGQEKLLIKALFFKEAKPIGGAAVGSGQATEVEKEKAQPKRYTEKVGTILQAARSRHDTHGSSRFKITISRGAISDPRELSDFIRSLNEQGASTEAGVPSFRVSEKDVSAVRQLYYNNIHDDIKIELQVSYNFDNNLPAARKTAKSFKRAVNNRDQNSERIVLAQEDDMSLRSRPGHVEVNLPAEASELEGAIADSLYKMQTARPNRVYIRDDSWANRRRFTSKENVYILGGNSNRDLESYKSGRKKLTRPVPATPVHSAQQHILDAKALKEKLIKLSKQDRAGEKMAVWLNGTNHTDETIAVIAEMKHKHNVSIIANTDIKADQRYSAIWKKPRSRSLVDRARHWTGRLLGRKRSGQAAPTASA